MFANIFKIKVKKYTDNKYEYLAMIIVFIDVPDGNLQWDSWCCQMIDYSKGFIFSKFKLNFFFQNSTV